jgi:hypothetical protein
LVSGCAFTTPQSNTPNCFCASGSRSMPSVCSTAACAARHDQIADAVLSRAQSTSLPRVGQYGSFPQIGSARLGAGHHQAVETAVPQFGNIAVSRRGFLQAAIAARNVRQRVEPQPHDDIVGRRPYELDELAFRRLECGIGHVIDQPDLDAVVAAQLDCGCVGRSRVEEKRHFPCAPLFGGDER